MKHSFLPAEKSLPGVPASGRHNLSKVQGMLARKGGILDCCILSEPSPTPQPASWCLFSSKLSLCGLSSSEGKQDSVPGFSRMGERTGKAQILGESQATSGPSMSLVQEQWAQGTGTLTLNSDFGRTLAALKRLPTISVPFLNPCSLNGLSCCHQMH